MKHSFLDRYSNINSVLRSWDPRVKIIVFFVILLFVVTAAYNNRLEFVGYALLILGIVILSRIPLGFIAKKALQILPFVVLTACFLPFVKRGDIIFEWKGFVIVSCEGWHLFQITIARGVLAVVLLIVLINSMPFASFLKVLQTLHVPVVFVSIIAFMYRFLFLIADESERMIRAKNSRAAKLSLIREVKTLSGILGSLFIRTYDRSERVYQAMCARGFKGEIHILSDFHMRANDWILAAVFLAAVIGIKIFL